MTPEFGSFVNFISVFFGRLGTWFLYGKALAEFVSSDEFEHCKVIDVAVLDISDGFLKEKAKAHGMELEQVSNGVYAFYRNGKKICIHLFSSYRKGTLICSDKVIRREWVLCPENIINDIRRKRPGMGQCGRWRRQVDEINPYEVYLPYCYGTILDEVLPGWFLKTKKRKYPTEGDIFFSEKRKENGRRLISGLYEAAEIAGIKDRLFAGFGTTLGYLMFGDFIPKDRDIDMCILSDGMTQGQYDNYAELAYDVDTGKKPSRWEKSKKVDGTYYWFSVGYKNPVSEGGCKSCNWFFFSWNKMWLHSKGGRWVNPKKINMKTGYNMDDEAIALGMPQNFIDKLVEVDFNGIKVKIPEKAGSCCDFWYPGWSPRGEGASAHRQVIIIKKWMNKNSWRMA